MKFENIIPGSIQLSMKDHLSEFETLAYKKGILSKIIIWLFLISIISIYLIELRDVVKSSFSILKNDKMEIFIFLIINLIPIIIIYQYSRGTKIGWFLTVLLVSISFCFFGRMFYLFVKNTEQPHSITEMILYFYFFIISSLLLGLLYHKKIRLEFKIDIRYLTVAIMLGIIFWFCIVLSFD